MIHAIQALTNHFTAGATHLRIVWAIVELTIGALLAAQIIGQLVKAAIRPLRLYRYGHRILIGRRSLWAGCRVRLSDGREAIVRETHRENDFRAGVVVLERINGHALSGWFQPPVEVAPWGDCTRIPRHGIRYTARAMYRAIRGGVTR